MRRRDDQPGRGRVPRRAGRPEGLATLSLGAAVADFAHGGLVGALMDEETAVVAGRRASRRGYVAAADTAAGFAWIRPDEGVWMNVVNNYLSDSPRTAPSYCSGRPTTRT